MQTQDKIKFLCQLFRSKYSNVGGKEWVLFSDYLCPLYCRQEVHKACTTWNNYAGVRYNAKSATRAGNVTLTSIEDQDLGIIRVGFLFFFGQGSHECFMQR